MLLNKILIKKMIEKKYQMLQAHLPSTNVRGEVEMILRDTLDYTSDATDENNDFFVANW